MSNPDDLQKVNEVVENQSEKKISPTKDGHIAVLDGYRGMAILLVLMFHIWGQGWHSLNATLPFFGRVETDTIARTGYMGVELFFFISGFCLFYPYARSIFEGRPLQTLRHYTYRRFIKIAPSAWFSIIIMLLTVGFIFGQPDNKFFDAFTHFSFTNGLFKDTFYDKLNTVMWSLSIEVQFYVVFPVICFLFRKSPFIVYGVGVVGAVIYRYWAVQSSVEIQHTGDPLFFLMNQLPGVLDIFLGGMMSALIVVWLRNKVRIGFWVKLGATAIAIVSIFLFVNMLRMQLIAENGDVYRAENRMYFVWVVMLMITSSCFAFSVLKKLIANRVLIFLSIISFNLYIWHQWIAVMLWKNRIPPYTGDDFHTSADFDTGKYTIIAYVLSILVAVLITYLLERPLLKKGFKGVFVSIIMFFKNIIRLISRQKINDSEIVVRDNRSLLLRAVLLITVLLSMFLQLIFLYTVLLTSSTDLHKKYSPSIENSSIIIANTIIFAIILIIITAYFIPLPFGYKKYRPQKGLLLMICLLAYSAYVYFHSEVFIAGVDKSLLIYIVIPAVILGVAWIGVRIQYSSLKNYETT